MGDRCYMHVTCRRQDKDRFDQLGFEQEFEPSDDSPVIEMTDQEANYAHADEMPSDIPYLAWHSSGDNYGEGRIACDGTHHAEVGATSDGFVVAWDHAQNEPIARSVEDIRHYIAVEQTVRERFESLRAIQPHARHEHRFNTSTRRCILCGRDAGDDAIEPQPCAS